MKRIRLGQKVLSIVASVIPQCWGFYLSGAVVFVIVDEFQD